MPKVSVCIPNYNHSLFLKARIESVLNQTFQDFEIILLDDCSTDNSREIIEQYSDYQKIKCIVYNEQNSGSTFRQWQKGIEISAGEFIWIAESDDLMEASFLEKAMEILSRDLNIGIFQCGSNWINEIGDITEVGSKMQSGYHNGKNYIYKMMTQGNAIVNASAVVFKKSFVSLPLGKEITDLKFCGDWLFWIKILEQADLYYLNENLNSFRSHSNNVSGKSKRIGLQYIEGIKVYTYIKSISPGKFKLFDLKDREWSFRFSKENFSLKTTLLFFKNSIKASLFIPLYVMWFKIKRSAGLINH